MLSDLFSCPICLEQFDKAKHLPKIISSCNHTLCSTCLTNIIGKKKECPLDRIKFAENVQKSEDFSTSLLVLQIIEEKLKTEYQMCDEHKIIKNLMCLDDKTWICEKCEALPKHKNHDIKSTQQLKTEAELKKKKLNSRIEELKSQKEEAEFYFKGLQKSISTAIGQEFNKITDALKKKDKEIFSKTEALIETYQNEKEKILEEDELLNEKWKKQASDLDNDINSRFVDTFKKLDNKKCPDFQIAKLLKNAKNIEKQHISAVQKLSNTIISAIKDFELKTTLNELIEIEESASIKDEEKYDPSKLIELFDIDIHEDSLTVFAESIPDKENKNKALLVNSNMLKEIKVLEIQFDQVNLIKQHCQGLKYIHSCCDQLSDLKLFFDGEHFKDEDLILFCLDPYWATKKLKSLYLDFDTSKVSDVSIKKFMTNLLPKMAHLNCLTLRLCKTQITSECMDNLSPDLFVDFADLSSFELLLNGTQITDAWNIKFCKQIKPISKQLKIFSLGLGSTQITDKSIIILAQENLSFMKNVERLFLDFRETLITDASISAIGKNTLFNRLPLQSLTINIQNTKATDSGIKDFCSNLPEAAKSLKSLDLRFDIPAISDKSIIYLIKEILPQMVSLKALEISIEGTQVTDKIAHEFNRLKSIFKNLQIFSLRIKDTKITQDGVELIIGFIKLAEKPNLASLDFDFSGIPVKKEIKAELNQIKAQLPRRI